MNFLNLNVLKAISIIGIIIAHCFLQLNYECFGRFCAYLFVQIFFATSAFLLGLKYGYNPIKMEFLWKRWRRLSCVYYPFLLISILSLWGLGQTINVQDIISHITYTNYILQYQICGVSFGHLWYISMQMICYIMITIICMPVLFGITSKLVDSIGKIFCFVLFVLIISYVFTLLKIPCRIPIVLSSYLVIFLRAKVILNWFDKCRVNKKKNVYIWALFLIFNSITLLLFFYWNLNDKLLIRDVLVFITSCCWMVLFMVPLRSLTGGNVIGFVSGISFEIYLVHHPFVLGQFSWFNESNGTGNIYLNVICLPILIVILAWLLNIIGKFVSSLFASKKEILEK
ncbi:MAG: acyltransferase [Bacteroidaceae bacterium]|nr:acyltransferase [Bacteroidaceae bacterium]